MLLLSLKQFGFPYPELRLYNYAAKNRLEDNLQIERHIDLSLMNTLGLPCLADTLMRIRAKGDLDNARLELRNQGCLIIGGGSNLLLPEKLKRPVIKMEMTGIRVVDENKNRCLIDVAAGVSWHQLVLWSVKKGLWGIENLALIPGTVGAAPIQNIGAYGVELADVLDWVELFHLKTAETIRLTPNECKLSYRDSIFKHELQDEVIITGIGIRLSRQPCPQLSYGPLQQFREKAPSVINSRQIVEEVCRIRLTKLPDPEVLSNAGSFFKNPVVSNQHYQQLLQLFPEIVAYEVGEKWKLAAAWLIEKAGFKGEKRKHVGVHQKQALVLVHHGGGSAAELLELVDDIQQKIYATFKITLQREVRVIAG